jgi:hypothetical protein
MAVSDPITDQQIAFIDGLARDCVIDYEGEETLNDYVLPVYGCKLFEMNRGQASMLIDDLKYQNGEISVKPEYESIFSDRDQDFTGGGKA